MTGYHLKLFIVSFPRRQKLGLEEPGNNTKDTLVPYTSIDTVVISEISIYKQLYMCTTESFNWCSSSNTIVSFF